MMHIEIVPEGKEMHTVDKCIILFRDKTPSALLRMDDEKKVYYISYDKEAASDDLLMQWVNRKKEPSTFVTPLTEEDLTNDAYLGMGRALEEATG